MKNNHSIISSFLNAWHGMMRVLPRQRNFMIEISITLMVFAAGFLFRIDAVAWCIILICIGVVIAFEAINTALEHLADAVNPETHPLVGKAKDVAAAAVLIASIVAGIVGIIIFAPRIIAILL